MSLPHAILTALLEKPSSGLELTRRFDKSIGYFWSATHQQIYRELGKLEEAGLIRALPSAQPSRGQKKEFEVLPAGRAELGRWVGESQDPKQIRDPLLLRLRAAGVVGPHGLTAELRRHLELHRRQLAMYEAIEERDFPPERNADHDRLRRLVLHGGTGLETFWLRWLEEALAEVSAMEDAVRDAVEDASEHGGPATGTP
ncbi:PadR family transcriptional regulator [Streptomyces sp. 12297]|uniref:PadR family transcriptional regulator n=1 Tax=Streptomyces sp. NBC_00239 TaxID=2903640 RepID=UPI002E289F29|nr:PadR family transcriptional regulator [Streptomyces sp. NBC_00239]